MSPGSFPMKGILGTKMSINPNKTKIIPKRIKNLPKPKSSCIFKIYYTTF